MADEKKVPKVYWLNDFLGMSQRQAVDAIAENLAILAVNISFDKPGVWKKRKGSDLLSTTQAGKGVYGLVEYTSLTSPPVLRAVRSTDLDEYSATGDSLTAIDSSQFTAEEKVDSENYKNRVYHISPKDNLCYETGGSCTDVGASGNEIRGRCVATAQNTLYVGGVTYLGGAGSQSLQDRVYYSLFDVDNNEPGDTFYNSDETMATSTRWFTIRKPVTGLFAYGTPAKIYAFNEDECYRFDLGLENKASGIERVFKVGLANPRAITLCNNWMVWMDPYARVWAYGGAGQPKPLSWDMEDDTTGESVMSAIERSELENVCAGSIGSTFYFSIGNIDWFDKSLDNVLLKGLMSQKLEYVLWGLDTLPVKPAIFSPLTLGNKRTLCFGCDGVDDVYEMNTGTNDGSTAIDAFVRTKFTSFKKPLSTKDLSEIWIKYRPQSADNTYLRVAYAKDSEMDYTEITDPDGSPAVTSYGKIDMYDTDYETKLDDIRRVGVPSGVSGRTFSIEIGNSQSAESFSVSGIGFVYTERSLDVTLKTD